MPSEQEILKVIRAIIPNSKKFLFDDAAVIEKDLIVTTDTLVENTHFTLKDYAPEEIGWKSLAVNLSDIAAMGGKPLYALVSLSLSRNITLNFVKRFYLGLLDCAKKYKTQIIGGNLARSKEINIAITVIGKLVSKNIPKRSNAKPGDLVFATGTFGYAIKTPIPQLKLGQKIVSLCNRVALMDSSDGLADCLIQIANESKVKIVVNKDKIPISKNLTKVSKELKKNSTNLALYGGEDYQLVGTASERDCKKLKKIKEIKIIGEVIKGNGAFLKQKNNKLVKLDLKKTYAHFT